MRKFVLFTLAIVSLLPGQIYAGSKKSAPITIRLHGEGNRADGESFVTEIQLKKPPQKIFIHKVPEVSERDIKTFLPFPGNDGMIGAYFRLDPHGTNKLQQFTTEQKGRIGVILINGRIASAVRVTPNSDGIFFVPGGLLPEEVLLLQKQFPIIGQESEFGKKPARQKKEATQ